MKGRKEIDREKIQKLYEEGNGYKKIAEEMNCTVTTVRNAIKEYKERIGIAQLQKALDENRELKIYIKRLEQTLEKRTQELVKYKNEATFLSEELKNISDELFMEKSQSKFDFGKIISLRKAGWSFQKIADEVGSSCTNVFRIIKALSKEEGEKCIDARIV